MISVQTPACTENLGLPYIPDLPLKRKPLRNGASMHWPSISMVSPSITRGWPVMSAKAGIAREDGAYDLDDVSRDCLAVPTAEKVMKSTQMQPSTLLFRPGLNY